MFNVSEYYVGEMVGCILRMSADAIVTVVRVRNENIYVFGAKCRTKGRGRYHSHDWLIRRNRGGDKRECVDASTRQYHGWIGGEVMMRPDTIMLQLVTKRKSSCGNDYIPQHSTFIIFCHAPTFCSSGVTLAACVCC